MMQYEYDYEMVNEMQIIMENNEVFYDAVRVIKELYYSDDAIYVDALCFTINYPEVVSHAACYAFDTFVDIWEEIEGTYLLQAEYFKACYKVIPELMVTM